MTLDRERRRAPRINVNIPTLIEVIGHRQVSLHPNLMAVYERVQANTERVGEKHPGILKDLSTNGAFIAGPPLPLLSRVAFTFPLEGFGQVEVLGWTLWRRKEACEIPAGDETVKLLAGFGVLFEAMDMEARQFVSRLVRQAE